MENKDMVNHPDHYISSKGLEVIDVIEAFTEDLSGISAVCTGNAIKYICRWSHKNGVEDLKKARWYITHLIELMESGETDKEEMRRKEAIDEFKRMMDSRLKHVTVLKGDPADIWEEDQ